jgi:hypothetical protein
MTMVQKMRAEDKSKGDDVRGSAAQTLKVETLIGNLMYHLSQ